MSTTAGGSGGGERGGGGGGRRNWFAMRQQRREARKKKREDRLLAVHETFLQIMVSDFDIVFDHSLAYSICQASIPFILGIFIPIALCLF